MRLTRSLSKRYGTLRVTMVANRDSAAPQHHSAIEQQVELAIEQGGPAVAVHRRGDLPARGGHHSVVDEPANLGRQRGGLRSCRP